MLRSMSDTYEDHGIEDGTGPRKFSVQIFHKEINGYYTYWWVVLSVIWKIHY